MTPQERQLVDELFERLAKLESTSHDPDAERLITDGTMRAPHAVYALVQTALVQDEALKRANARIEELQARHGGEESSTSSKAASSTACATPCPASAPRAASVPTVRPQATQSSFAGARDESQIGYPAPGSA